MTGSPGIFNLPTMCLQQFLISLTLALVPLAILLLSLYSVLHQIYGVHLVENILLNCCREELLICLLTAM